MRKSHGLMVIYVDKQDQATIILHNTQRNKSSRLIDVLVLEFSEKLDQLTNINNYYEQNSLNDASIQDWETALHDF